MDQNEDGLITVPDFISAAKESGVLVSEKEAEMVLKLLDIG